jgi:hypothetical protein
MRETEARTKWCPMVRVGATTPDGNVIAVNRHGPGQLPPELCCMGSDCTMWRSGAIISSSGLNDDGYCGLAGQRAYNS